MFLRTDSRLCIYHLFVWSSLKFLHNSQWITLPAQSYLVLYSFCANLLHSLIMWLIVSSLSPYNLHLLFCCVFFFNYFCFDIILIALFCAAFRRDSVSLLKFPFLSHVQFLSCEIPLVGLLECQNSCFAFHFCFLGVFVLLMLVLSVLLLVAVISLPIHFLCSLRDLTLQFRTFSFNHWDILKTSQCYTYYTCSFFDYRMYISALSIFIQKWLIYFLSTL